MPPSARAARRLQWVLWPAVVIVCLVVVGQSSYAAFSDRTGSSGNSLAAGTVVLADDDSGSALFSLSGLRPGASGSRCFTVTSSGSLPSSVKLYATDAATTRAMSTYVSLVITQGSGGSYNSCNGFVGQGGAAPVYSGTMANLTSSATSYGTGLGTWNPTGTDSETRTYLVTYTLLTSTPDSVQGGTASLGLTWEAQNT